ncbi:hypothetical protein Riv7116_4842 [Rivularia sp. PCC 7116]|uniref:hypothetical protein n=1 Tax=Rivularia sp. PCC 7116 TaxID=373994 RepID=UPI00029EE4F7|nr:hypothetical protein [Rivularia sp. PCC 7116]AFY57253.1 hypothetical protein Riv7116_4842 [Rivularia sp. PCC 7116]
MFAVPLEDYISFVKIEFQNNYDFIVMEEIIDDVKQNTGDKIFWTYPIVNKLQEYDYSLVVRWAVECVQLFTPEYEPYNLAKIDKFLQQIVEELNKSNLTSDECRKIYQEVWYSPWREDAQTAVTHLWWSIANFKDGEESEAARGAGIAVEVILPDTKNHLLLDRYLEIALRIYKKYQPQNPTCD